MRYEKPVAEPARARSSVRTFTGGPIEADKLERLQDACASQDRGVFGEPARFTLVENPFSKDLPVKLGDHGLQRNPRHFFIGAIRQGYRSRESWGYLLEHLVLKSTELGPGTCWMGYFNREFFAEYTTWPDEIIPTLAVVGVPAEKPRLGERFIRAGIGANARRDWKEMFFSAGLHGPCRMRAQDRIWRRWRCSAGRPRRGTASPGAWSRSRTPGYTTSSSKRSSRPATTSASTK